MNLLEEDYSELYNLEGEDMNHACCILEDYRNVVFINEVVANVMDNDCLMKRTYRLDGNDIRLFYTASDGIVTCVELL